VDDLIDWARDSYFKQQKKLLRQDASSSNSLQGLFIFLKIFYEVKHIKMHKKFLSSFLKFVSDPLKILVQFFYLLS